tara:strand:- start:18137 stop:18700 length:564 start_codon:yes stop_codon:yes gene_type:complete
MNKKVSKVKKLTPKLKNEMRQSFVYGIETDGVKEFPTLDALIKKHKVAKSSLYRLAQTEKWKYQRDEHQITFEKEIEKKRLQRRVEESINFDNSSINLAKGIYSTVAKMLQDNTLRINRGQLGMPAAQLRSLVSAAATAQRIAKLALGESTENINANVKDDTAFREAMEILDEYARSKSGSNDITLQ